MRIPGSKVYRAFPELDRFTDESCQKFVRAAMRGVGKKAVMAAVVIPVAIFGFGCALYVWLSGFTVLEKSLGTRFDSMGLWMLPLAAVLLIMAVVGVLPALVAKDLILRFSISRVFRDSGTCFACAYGLIGLPVSREKERWCISCPECHTECEVDSALAVLSGEEGGRVVLERVNVSQDGWRNDWYPRLVRSARVGGIGLGVIAASLALFIAGFYVFSWVQASRAAKDVIAPTTLQAMLAEAYADQADDGGGTVEMRIEPIRARISEIITDARQIAFGAPEFDHFTEAMGLGGGEKSGDGRDDEKRRSAKEIHEAYSQGEILGSIARLKGMHAGVEFGISNTNWWTRSRTAKMISDGSLREYCFAKAFRSWRSDDEEGFVQAVDAVLVLARQLQGQPSAVEWMTGALLESDMLALSRMLLAEPQNADRAAWLGRAVEGHSEGATASRAAMATMLLTRAMTAGDYSNVAWYRNATSEFLAEKVKALLFGQRVMWGGNSTMPATYATNKAYLLAVEQEIIVNLGLPVSGRAYTPLMPTSGIMYGAPWSMRLEDYNDRLAVEKAATKAMIAVEQYRLTHGAYPRSLAEALSESQAAAAVEQRTGQPLGYRRLTPGDDRHERGYLLYTIGLDGVDDGGAGDDPVLNDPAIESFWQRLRHR
jgi:hypothetical protein